MDAMYWIRHETSKHVLCMCHLVFSAFMHWTCSYFYTRVCDVPCLAGNYYILLSASFFLLYIICIIN